MLESTAKHKACPNNLESACVGSDCMAWRYSSPPWLQRIIALTFRRVCEILERDPDSIIDVDSFMRSALDDPRVTRDLAREKSYGWLEQSPAEYSEEDVFIFWTCRRDTDPDTKGYCGLAGSKGAP